MTQQEALAALIADLYIQLNAALAEIERLRSLGSEEPAHER